MRHRLGVIGYSGTPFDEKEGRGILKREISLRAIHHPDLEIVSGLTAIGIPKLAYQVAVDLGLRTVGIACSKAHEYDCWPCDEIVIMGNEWGAESTIFLSSIHEMIKVGGGKQSAAEFAAFTGPKTEFKL